MTSFNKLIQGVSQQFHENSLSWGSLLVWIGGLAAIILIMTRFSQIY